MLRKTRERLEYLRRKARAVETRAYATSLGFMGPEYRNRPGGEDDAGNVRIHCGARSWRGDSPAPLSAFRRRLPAPVILVDERTRPYVD